MSLSRGKGFRDKGAIINFVRRDNHVEQRDKLDNVDKSDFIIVER